MAGCRKVKALLHPRPYHLKEWIPSLNAREKAILHRAMRHISGHSEGLRNTEFDTFLTTRSTWPDLFPLLEARLPTLQRSMYLFFLASSAPAAASAGFSPFLPAAFCIRFMLRWSGDLVLLGSSGYSSTKSTEHLCSLHSIYIYIYRFPKC